ncbi:MAG: hypothetical protein AMXMBFR47_02640 [Planctomycetota bacterium]
MPLDESRFIRTRPYLFHLTSRQNLGRIRELRTLHSAASLLERAGRMELNTIRRVDHFAIEVDGEAVSLRDQKPLHRGPMRLEGGWTYEDFVAHVNSLVFFWPGSEEQPIDYGARHFERYRHEGPVIIRIPSGELIGNGAESLYSRCNSGAPRCSRRKHAPRGPDTFVPAARFDGKPGNVVEVAFSGQVAIPDAATVRGVEGGRWQAL